MNIDRADLNLLLYLDILLQERNVTRAAQQLGITQPALSNGLKRLREMFNDPLLIRSSEGMTPTERAIELQPQVREVLSQISTILQPEQQFIPADSHRVFRVMASDYAEATLFPLLVKRIRELAPDIVLDILTPSDISFRDLEQGKVDMAINRFDHMPQSFHQVTVWKDSFSCLLNRNNPAVAALDLTTYLESSHIWVSKTGIGVGFGMSPDKPSGLGWIDQALNKMGYKRNISIFTRHYQVPGLIVGDNDLIATLPTKVAQLQQGNSEIVILDPPFDIPEFELKMAWSPLLHHNAAHRWLRSVINEVARALSGSGL
ncbi:MAG: LysR family transcriptional regulator [Pseudomonadales bacterium]|nr:LysR family transcriptional regulator [Pseudomonadales bacterium]